MSAYFHCNLILKWSEFESSHFQLRFLVYQSSSIEAFTKSLKNLSLSKLSEEQKHQLSSDIKANIENVKKNVVFSNLSHFPEEENRSLDIIEEHPEIEGFTKKIGIQYSDTQGRFSVATEVIEAGEVISKDKAVTSIVLFNENMEFCYHCLIHVASPIPCQKCAGVVFCSLQCQQEAFQR